MVWCLILNFCFLLSSVVGFGIPKLSGSDVLINPIDQIKHCHNPISVKRVIIDILEHVKENPHTIDIIIDTLKSETTQESLLPKYQLNLRLDSTRLFKAPFECLKVIKRIAEIAYGAFQELMNYPSCLKYILPVYKAANTSDPEVGDKDLTLRNVMDLILQEMNRYAELKDNEAIPDKIQTITPKISFLQEPNFEEYLFNELLPNLNDINKPISNEEVYHTDSQPLSVFQPNLQLIGESPSSLGIPKNVPGATASLLPQKMPSSLILPLEEQPITVQAIDPLQLIGPKLKENSIFEINDRNLPKSNDAYKSIFPNHDVIDPVYPKLMIITQEPVISGTGPKFPNQNIQPNFSIDRIEIQPITVFQPNSQLAEESPQMTLEILKNVPEATTSLLPQKIPSSLILPVEEQDISVQAIDPLQLIGPKLKEKSKFDFNNRNPAKISDSYKTIFPNREVIESVYPKLMVLTQEPIISGTGSKFMDQYIKPNFSIDAKIPDENDHSGYGDMNSFNDNNQLVYVTPESFNPNIKQPLQNMSMSPKSNIMKLILQLSKKQQLNNEIEKNIMALLKQSQAALNPRLYEVLFILINTYKNGLVDDIKFNEILIFLLEPEINNFTNEESVEFLWRLLQPDEKGQINKTNLNLIMSFIHSADQDSQSLESHEKVKPLLKSTEEEIIDPKDIEKKQLLLNQNVSKTPTADYTQSNIFDINKTFTDEDKIPFLNSKNVKVLLPFLLSNNEGKIDAKSNEILPKIILLTEKQLLTTEDVKTILSFMKEDTNADLKSKRLDIVLLILKYLSDVPMLHDTFIGLLNANVVKSKYMNILLCLYRERMLSIQLLEVLVTLLQQEKSGHIDGFLVNKLFILLEPYKYNKPELVNHIYNMLNVPNSYNNQPFSTDFKINQMEIPTTKDVKWSNNQNENIQIPTIQPELWRYFWGQYNPNINTSSNGNSILAILQIARDINSDYVIELLKKYGYMELTFMIKNPKPPIHYVKFKIPIIKFITDMKSLILKYPQLSNNPMKLLQKLIVRENVSEVTPILNDLEKEDLLKLMVLDGNFVGAKLLREHSNLNEQVNRVHGLTAEISPEDILQQYNANSAEYFTNTASNVGRQTNIPNFNNGQSVSTGDFPYISYNN